MTARQLADRLDVVPSRITALEKAEVTGATTLKSMREAAEAMGCTLVYAIVPVRPLEVMVRERAAVIAGEELARTNHSMQLEDQALNATDLAEARERLITDLINGSLRRLWDHDD